MRHLAMCGAVAMIVAGCAASGSADRAMPAATPDVGRGAVGTWRGTISGIEMQTAAGQGAIPATLTVAADGTWTLAAGSMRATSNAVTANGRRLVFDGTVTAGDAILIGRPVRLVLEPHGDALYGGTDTYFSGIPVSAPIPLKRVTAS